MTHPVLEDVVGQVALDGAPLVRIQVQRSHVAAREGIHVAESAVASEPVAGDQPTDAVPIGGEGERFAGGVVEAKAELERA